MAEYIFNSSKKPKEVFDILQRHPKYTGTNGNIVFLASPNSISYRTTIQIEVSNNGNKYRLQLLYERKKTIGGRLIFWVPYFLITAWFLMMYVGVFFLVLVIGFIIGMIQGVLENKKEKQIYETYFYELQSFAKMYLED